MDTAGPLIFVAGQIKTTWKVGNELLVIDIEMSVYLEVLRTETQSTHNGRVHTGNFCKDSAVTTRRPSL